VSTYAISTPPFADLDEQLADELEILRLRLERQVLRLRACGEFEDNPLRGVYISDARVDSILERLRGDSATPEIEGLTRRIETRTAERDACLIASLAARQPLPLATVATRFGLSTVERELVVLALAPEVDLRWETLYAYAQNDATLRRPTVALALDLLCTTPADRRALREALRPDSRLLAGHLLTLAADSPEQSGSTLALRLRIERRVADFLLGTATRDARLVDILETPPSDVSALPPELTAALTRAATAIADGGVALLAGAYGTGRRSGAACIARALGRPLLAANLACAACEVGEVLGLLCREARLEHAVLLLGHFDKILDGRSESVLEAACAKFRTVDFPVLLSSDRTWEPAGALGARPFFSFAFERSGLADRRNAWRRAAPTAAEDDLDVVAGKFLLSTGQIRDAGRRAAWIDLQDGRPDVVTSTALHAAARAQSRPRLGTLATKVEPRFGWSDIVLPSRSMRQLREIYSAVQLRARVYAEWGFEERHALGRGVNALFSGPSGAGKTMAASILARELGHELYKIDLSAVVSKYIGETEKNLSEIFEQAQSSNVMLFFDEADSLFGKRSQVKDAHDRYANIEVAYLLQRIEEYDGVVILATNMKRSIDDAFARRMHHTVEFPAAGLEQRRALWRRALPEAAPRGDDLDLDFLAQQFELSGGNIRNIAVAAALLAAEENRPIRMAHLVTATARELQKLGRLPARTDFRHYCELIRERPADLEADPR
jgi:MoxR-like ATPase